MWGEKEREASYNKSSIFFKVQVMTCHWEDFQQLTKGLLIEFFLKNGNITQIIFRCNLSFEKWFWGIFVYQIFVIEFFKLVYSKKKKT